MYAYVESIVKTKYPIKYCYIMISIYIVDSPINNERFCSLKFPVTTSSMVHGFAGYFDTVLYNQITLSKCK